MNRYASSTKGPVWMSPFKKRSTGDYGPSSRFGSGSGKTGRCNQNISSRSRRLTFSFMSIRSSTLTAFLVTAIPLQQLSAANWSAWRGPNQTGVALESNLPVRFGTAENVRWHVPLPAPGNSSPIVWGNRVFVTQFIPAENRRTLICLDRSNGKVLWQSGIVYTESEQTQENNPYCAGTPATDGKLIVVCFGSPGVYAYDFDGKEVWHRDLGKISHMFGNAVCPIIHQQQCFLNYGPDANARLIALDLSTGKTVWEAVPPKPDPSETPSMQGPRAGDPNRPPPGGPPGPRGDGGAREGTAGGPADAPPLGRPTGPGGPPPGSADIAGGPGGPGGGFRPPSRRTRRASRGSIMEYPGRCHRCGPR